MIRHWIPRRRVGLTKGWTLFLKIQCGPCTRPRITILQSSGSTIFTIICRHIDTRHDLQSSVVSRNNILVIIIFVRAVFWLMKQGQKVEWLSAVLLRNQQRINRMETGVRYYSDEFTFHNKNCNEKHTVNISKCCST